MSERPTVRTISWAIAVRSTGSSAVSSAMRAASRSCSDVWPFAAASAIRSMSSPSPRRRDSRSSRRCGSFVNPHPLESSHRALDQFGQPGGQLRLVRLGHLAGLLANRHRVRKPQQIAGRELTADNPARPRTLECLLQRRHERLVQLHLRQRGATRLHAHAHLDPSARDHLLHQAANALLLIGERGRNTQLQIQVAMVHRPQRHVNRRKLVLASEGREARHALDHVVFVTCQRSVPPRRAQPSASGGLPAAAARRGARTGCRARATRRACRPRPLVPGPSR